MNLEEAQQKAATALVDMPLRRNGEGVRVMPLLVVVTANGYDALPNPDYEAANPNPATYTIK